MPSVGTSVSVSTLALSSLHSSDVEVILLNLIHVVLRLSWIGDQIVMNMCKWCECRHVLSCSSLAVLFKIIKIID